MSVKVQAPPFDVQAELFKLTTSNTVNQPRMVRGSTLACIHTKYKRVNLTLLLSILRLRRESYGPTEWFTPILKAAIDVCPVPVLKTYDGYGNLYVQVHDGDVAFTSHLDTVAGPKAPPDSINDIMLGDDGVMFLRPGTLSHCLGADDGAGIYIMLEMIQAGVPGRYCFFQDEEVGRVGSNFAAKDDSGFWCGIEHMVSFDRRNDGVINTQLSGRCCSDNFAVELAKRLGRSPSKVQAGIYTDSASFMSIIPECTNVGVGYNWEHTDEEELDLNILSDVIEKVTNPEMWGNLPVYRNPEEGSSVLDVWDEYFAASASAPEPEDTTLNDLFRTVSQLGKTALVQWIQDNPNEAAAYIMVFSDYGFKQELLEVGNAVCHDWNGFQTLLDDKA